LPDPGHGNRHQNRPAGRQNVEISSAPRQPDVSFGFSVLDRNCNSANGIFELRKVAPGSYWVHATTMPDLDTRISTRKRGHYCRRTFRKSAFIEAGRSGGGRYRRFGFGESGDDTCARFSIPGRLIIEGQELSTIDGFKDIQITLRPNGPNDYLQLPRPMTPDGEFSLDNVFSGEYLVSISHPQ
jgi:hypothetical protein